MVEEASQADKQADEPQIGFTDWFNQHGGRLALFTAVASTIAAIVVGNANWTWLASGGENNAAVVRNLALAAAVPPSATFARHPRVDAGGADPEATERTSENSSRSAREDVVTAVRAAIDCVEQHPDNARAARLRLDLQGALLPEVNLQNADLTGAQLHNANLTSTRFSSIRPPSLRPRAPDNRFIEHDGRWYERAVGLTQTELNTAMADSRNPPHLDHVFDAETDKLLAWGGEPAPDISGDDDADMYD